MPTEEDLVPEKKTTNGDVDTYEAKFNDLIGPNGVANAKKILTTPSQVMPDSVKQKIKKGLSILRKEKLSNTVLFTKESQAAVLLAGENALVVAEALDNLDDAGIQITREISYVIGSSGERAVKVANILKSLKSAGLLTDEIVNLCFALSKAGLNVAKMLLSLDKKNASTSELSIALKLRSKQTQLLLKANIRLTKGILTGIKESHIPISPEGIEALYRLQNEGIELSYSLINTIYSIENLNKVKQISLIAQVFSTFNKTAKPLTADMVGWILKHLNDTNTPYSNELNLICGMLQNAADALTSLNNDRIILPEKIYLNPVNIRILPFILKLHRQGIQLTNTLLEAIEQDNLMPFISDNIINILLELQQAKVPLTSANIIKIVHHRYTLGVTLALERAMNLINKNINSVDSLNEVKQKNPSIPSIIDRILCHPNIMGMAQALEILRTANLFSNKIIEAVINSETPEIVANGISQMYLKPLTGVYAPDKMIDYVIQAQQGAEVFIRIIESLHIKNMILSEKILNDISQCLAATASNNNKINSAINVDYIINAIELLTKKTHWKITPADISSIMALKEHTEQAVNFVLSLEDDHTNRLHQLLFMISSSTSPKAMLSMLETLHIKHGIKTFTPELIDSILNISNQIPTQHSELFNILIEKINAKHLDDIDLISKEIQTATEKVDGKGSNRGLEWILPESVTRIISSYFHKATSTPQIQDEKQEEKKENADADKNTDSEPKKPAPPK